VTEKQSPLMPTYREQLDMPIILSQPTLPISFWLYFQRERPTTTMAHVITAVKGAEADLVPIRTALLSVSDKTGLLELGKALVDRGVLVRGGPVP
jgi:hypothetical protein